MKHFRLKQLIAAGCLTFLLGFTIVALPARHAYAQTSDPRCAKKSFFGLKPWYYYLPLANPSADSTRCTVDLSLTTSGQGAKPDTTQINKLWLVGIVLFEDLLRVSALLAVGFVMYGGVRYITSQGEPEHTKAALNTIINALIGLAIAVAGATIISFVGKRLGG